PIAPIFGREESYALAATLLVYTPTYEVFLPFRLYARGGGHFKHISDSNNGQTEDGVGWVLGGGIQVDFTPSSYGRFDDEFVPRIGAERAINVMHTPTSASLGS